MKMNAKDPLWMARVAQNRMPFIKVLILLPVLLAGLAEAQPIFTRHPSNATVTLNLNREDFSIKDPTNVTLSVQASGASSLSYQWLLRGTNLAAATGPDLILTNISIADEGAYSVVATDSSGSVTSASAVVKVMIMPLFVVPPRHLSVPVGSNATFNVVVTGYPPPFRYEWRRSTTPLITNITDAPSNSLTITNVALDNPVNYRVVVKNAATSSGVTYIASLKSHYDADADGLPDDWEAHYGLNTNNAADAFADPDQDGLSNLQEKLAGTDPTTAQSALKLDRISPVPGGLDLEFLAMANQTYTLQYRSNLTEGNWIRMYNIYDTTTNRPVKIRLLTTHPAACYRLITPVTPW